MVAWHTTALRCGVVPPSSRRVNVLMGIEAFAGYHAGMNDTAAPCVPDTTAPFTTDTTTPFDVDISAVGALLADPARVAILLALLGGEAVPAGALARCAGVTPATASAHLARLQEAKWVAVERRGRRRYYRLDSPRVAALLEQAAHLAPRRSVRSLRGQQQAAVLRRARSCYDHLAGQLGVALTEALLRQDVLRVEGSDFALTPHGAAFLRERGVDLPAAGGPGRRRAFARRCLDWSERRDHLAGALGAAILTHWQAQGWIVRHDHSRAVALTPRGRAQLPVWGVVWPGDAIGPVPSPPGT